MCRFMCYKGHNKEVLWDLISRPTNSLVVQSQRSKERLIPTNGDGFGVGWYDDSISAEPGLYLTIRPAWNDRNIQSILSKISSNCFSAHIRDASVGHISRSNTHPFIYKNLLMMHNGNIPSFHKIKRKLRSFLIDESYNWIKGSTDSEHFFALFLDFLHKYDKYDEENVAKAIKKTIEVINTLLEEIGEKEPANINVNISDGKFVVASRYSNNGGEPLSLYYSKMGKFSFINNIFSILGESKSILVVSEKLNEVTSNWNKVPDNHIIKISNNFDLSLEEI
ncbi:MAG: Class II glutamine amidotransferase [uncultured Campylobacterales bacterium]|uniref:Class II glutamine amidotransferase n=1 Tax=uncultured Campylobacterales bacterium TaxID=352960 RepID=A0A6S6RVH7_9BACT|nr:MAG: Class II glutamine amidotransferase [uncultured Campylobacterales bacterium]